MPVLLLKWNKCRVTADRKDFILKVEIQPTAVQTQSKFQQFHVKEHERLCQMCTNESHQIILVFMLRLRVHL